jgi:hypothetical protein
MAFDVFRGGIQNSFCKTKSLAPILEVTRDEFNKLRQITALPMGGHSQGEPGTTSQLSEVVLESDDSGMYCDQNVHKSGTISFYGGGNRQPRKRGVPAAQSVMTMEPETPAAQNVITPEQMSHAAYIGLRNDSVFTDLELSDFSNGTSVAETEDPNVAASGGGTAAPLAEPNVAEASGVGSAAADIPVISLVSSDEDEGGAPGDGGASSGGGVPGTASGGAPKASQFHRKATFPERVDGRRVRVPCSLQATIDSELSVRDSMDGGPRACTLFECHCSGGDFNNKPMD